MRTLGLIGGITYHATSLYYTQINDHVQSTLRNGHSAPLILHSFDFAQTTHLFQTDRAALVQLFASAAQNMRQSGAGALALCVNTMHVFAEQIERESGLEVLHIIDFVGREAARRGVRKLGLLGTKSSMEGDFIVGRLREKFGVEVLVPEVEEVRSEMDSVIFGELAEKTISESTVELFVGAAKGMVEKGAEVVVLACTELQFFVTEERVGVPLLDTVTLHARGLAEWILDGQKGEAEK